jgi:hypothetical protein
MISRWMIPPPALTRFVTDQEGTLHIESGVGCESDAIAYLREQLVAWEEAIARGPQVVVPTSRMAKQGHAGREPGPGSGVRSKHPMGAFHGGAGPIPITHGPTPGYGPPGAAQFENPNAPPPPGFAYGVPNGGQTAATPGRPNMMAYGWGSGGAPPAPDPGAPGVAAMSKLNPLPAVCPDCHRLVMACDAQPNRCPGAETRQTAASAAAAAAAASAPVATTADAPAAPAADPAASTTH